jgi:hypothetical protein
MVNTVDLLVEVHEVRRDPLGRRVAAQHGCLESNAVRRFLREPAQKVEQRVLVDARDELVCIRNLDLVEVVVDLRPEGIPPRGVQRADRAIPRAQPRAELLVVRRRIRIPPAVVAELAVDLPADTLSMTIGF